MTKDKYLKKWEGILCQYGNRVTPSNWHLHPIDQPGRYFPGVLNVALDLNSASEVEWWEFEEAYGEDPYEARVVSGQQYHPISLFAQADPEARNAFEKFGEFTFAQTKIEMYPYWIMSEFYIGDIFTTLVHELAHLAVDRLVALKHRKQGIVNSAVSLGESQHGPLFQKALHRMALRVESLWSKRAAARIWLELNLVKKVEQ